MKFHCHEWEKIGKPRHCGFSYYGLEKVLIKCRCRICGKEEDRQFAGHQVGHLFDWTEDEKHETNYHFHAER